jgi:hypothetical protein
MSKHKQQIKEWLDANVNDGDDRSASSDRLYFSPDELQELVCELYDDVFAEDNAELHQEVKRRLKFHDEQNTRMIEDKSELILLRKENAELKRTLKLIWDFHKSDLSEHVQGRVIEVLKGGAE